MKEPVDFFKLQWTPTSNGIEPCHVRLYAMRSGTYEARPGKVNRVFLDDSDGILTAEIVGPALLASVEKAFKRRGT